MHAGFTKLHKPVHFAETLSLTKRWMADSSPDYRGADYALVRLLVRPPELPPHDVQCAALMSVHTARESSLMTALHPQAATVSHHGKNPNAGHYTADVRQPDGRWLRFDDATVTSVPLSMVRQLPTLQ